MWLLVAIAAVGLTLPAAAQTRMTSSVVASGGGVASGSGIILNGTIGQPVIGPAAGASTRVLQGFWHTTGKPATLDVAVTGSAISEMQADVSPNPCSGSTVLRLAVAARTDLRVGLYDLLGNEVELLYDGSVEPGEMRIGLDASNLPTGRYTIRVVAAKGSRTLPLLVVR
jgi:hypothetical protein